MLHMSRNHDDLDLNLLRVFDRIYKNRSLTTAAAQLGQTQSALSHALKKMRLIFRDDLFVRSKSGLQPTPRAQTLYDSIDAILGTIEREIIPAAHFEASISKRHFKLSMNDIAEVVLFRALLAFTNAHSIGCTFSSHRVSNENVESALDKGAIDLAIGIFPHINTTFFQRKLYQADYMVLKWKHHERIREKITWEEYATEEHIVISSGSDHYLQKNTLEPAGIRRKVHLTTEGFLSVPWLLEGTNLLATVPTHMINALCEAASIEKLQLPQPATPYKLASVWHPRSNSDAGHRWLRETIYSLMQAPPDHGLDPISV